jgi:hypothetical protein
MLWPLFQRHPLSSHTIRVTLHIFSLYSSPPFNYCIMSSFQNLSPLNSKKLTAGLFCSAGNTSANARDPGVMDAVFAAAFLLVVSGLGLGTTAFAVGEGCLSVGMRFGSFRGISQSLLHTLCLAQIDFPTLASSAAGSTLDIRLVRDHYVSICLPAMVLSSAAVFSLVYSCLTLL